MPEQAYGSKPIVDLAGKRLAAPYDEQITAVVVDQDLTSASYCQVTIADPGRDFVSSTGVEVGQELTAAASPVAEEEVDPIFVGRVHSIDVVFATKGQSVVLVAFDDSYLLTQHRLSRSFNNAGLSTVIKDLCQAAGVQVGRIETDSVVAAQVGLFDETPWDFITRSAARSGCVVRFDDGRLHVVKPPAASTGPEPGDHGADQRAQLVPGHNLTYLRVHSTTARQVGEVEVRGWDVAGKKQVQSTAPAATDDVDGATRPAEVGRELGSARLIDPRPEVDVQAVTDLHAEATGAGLASQHLVAEAKPSVIRH